MSDKELFNYWNRPPSQFALENEKRVQEIMRQLHEHVATRGEIKDMEAAGFILTTLYYQGIEMCFVQRPDGKGYIHPPTGFIKAFHYYPDAWQDAWIDYAIHELMPKSINKERNK